MKDSDIQMKWWKYIRRHEANIFNALFYDKEPVTDEDIHVIVSDIAQFFDLPEPRINSQCETFAKILTGYSANECELYYNLEILKDAGINNSEAFTMCFVHEMSHQLLFHYNLMLFEHDMWMQELAADLMAGVYANRNNIATGKFKYVLSKQPASFTHPSGVLRAEIVDYGRMYFEKRKGCQAVVASDVLALLPAFIYLHYGIIRADWEKVKDEIENPPPPPIPVKYRIEDLPDSNLLKQYLLRLHNPKDNEHENNR